MEITPGCNCVSKKKPYTCQASLFCSTLWFHFVLLCSSHLWVSAWMCSCLLCMCLIHSAFHRKRHKCVASAVSMMMMVCVCVAYHCSSCWVLCSLSLAACSVLYAPRSCPLSVLTSLSGSSTLLCSSALSTSTCSLSSSARHLFASDRSLSSDSWALLDKQNDTSLLGVWVFSTTPASGASLGTFFNFLKHLHNKTFDVFP